MFFFFFSSRRRHTRLTCDWSSDVCSSDLGLASTAVGVVPPQLSGMASGANNTARQLGLATGIAGLGAIFQSKIESTLTSLVAGTPASSHVHELSRAVASGGAGRALQAVPPAEARQG